MARITEADLDRMPPAVAAQIRREMGMLADEPKAHPDRRAAPRLRPRDALTGLALLVWEYNQHRRTGHGLATSALLGVLGMAGSVVKLALVTIILVVMAIGLETTLFLIRMGLVALAAWLVYRIGRRFGAWAALWSFLRWRWADLTGDDDARQ